MKHEMLQAFLDAHGVPGPPPPGVFCVVGDQYGGVGIGGMGDDGLGRALYHTDGQFNTGGWATPPFNRHALLPDPLALLKRAEDAERARDYFKDVLAGMVRRDVDRVTSDVAEQTAGAAPPVVDYLTVIRPLLWASFRESLLRSQGIDIDAPREPDPYGIDALAEAEARRQTLREWRRRERRREQRKAARQRKTPHTPPT